jgi:hypothetical protein
LHPYQQCVPSRVLPPVEDRMTRNRGTRTEMANSREVGILEKRSWHPWNPHLCFCHSDLEFSIPGACHFSVGEFLEIPSPDPDQSISWAAAGPAVPSHARPVVVRVRRCVPLTKPPPAVRFVPRSQKNSRATPCSSYPMVWVASSGGKAAGRLDHRPSHFRRGSACSCLILSPVRQSGS